MARKHQLLEQALANLARHRNNKDWVASASGKECVNVIGLLYDEAVEFQVDSKLLTEEHQAFGLSLHKKGLLKYPYDHCLFIINRHDGGEPLPLFVWHDAGKTPLLTFFFHKGDPSLKGLPLFSATIGDTGEYLLLRYPGVPMSQKFIDDAPQIISELASMAFAICSLLMSRNTYVDAEPAPEKLNKKRALKGKPPITEVRHIKIRTDERLVARGHQGGSHASPVMHWRRGHMRRLESGKLVPVAPTIVNASDEHKPLAKDYVING